MTWTVQKKPDNVSVEEWDRRRETKRRARMIEAGLDPDKKSDISITMSYRAGLVVLICFLILLVLYTGWLRHG